MEISKLYINDVKFKWTIGDEEVWEDHPHDVYCKKLIKYPACFHIDIDLKYIEPVPMTLPSSPMWNAYNPYELINEINFSKLEDIKNLVK